MSHDLAVTVRGYHSEEDSVLPLSWGSLLGLEREGGEGRGEGRGGEREGEGRGKGRGEGRGGEREGEGRGQGRGEGMGGGKKDKAVL